MHPTGTLESPPTTPAAPDHPSPDPVVICHDSPPGVLAPVAQAALACGDDPAQALQLATALGPELPPPGSETAHRWEVLATLGAVDLTVARAAEPHLDAHGILLELDAELPGERDGVLHEVAADATSTWGVWAAEARGTRVEARFTEGRWVLEGVKAWCSLADLVSHALVTAHLVDGRRRLFAVDLRAGHVRPQPAAWAPTGLRRLTTGAVRLTGAVAVPVGEAGWYLQRPGFSWGGIGVAACWYGGAVAVGRRLAAHGDQRRLDQVGHLHLGTVDLALHTARVALEHAARLVDDGHARGEAGRVLALRTRAVVRRAAEEVLHEAAHAMGPAPLTEETHARRVGDLGLYLRQEHGERDVATLGRCVDSTRHFAGWAGA